MGDEAAEETEEKTEEKPEEKTEENQEIQNNPNSQYIRNLKSRNLETVFTFT